AELGHPALPQGRVDPRLRQPEASPGALAVPVRAGERAAAAGDAGDRGVLGLDRGERGACGADARHPLRRGDPAGHEHPEDRADRGGRRALPRRRGGGVDEPGGAAAGRRPGRSGHGSVHPCRTGHGLAGQQRERRQRAVAARARAAAGWARGGRGWGALRLASDVGGRLVDRFPHAERATDWRGTNSVAVSALSQLELEPHPVPRWIVVGAGTGGTSATFGRLLTYRSLPTSLCVADVESSAFFEGWVQQDPTITTDQGSRIEGIGRPQVEPSFVPGVVDRMIRVPDAASVAAARYLSEHLGRRVGASTGTNLIACARLITQMRERGETGSVLTLLCDPGDRYSDTYFDDDWVASQGWELGSWREALERMLPLGGR